MWHGPEVCTCCFGKLDRVRLWKESGTIQVSLYIYCHCSCTSKVWLVCSIGHYQNLKIKIFMTLQDTPVTQYSYLQHYYLRYCILIVSNRWQQIQEIIDDKKTEFLLFLNDEFWKGVIKITLLASTRIDKLTGMNYFVLSGLQSIQAEILNNTDLSCETIDAKEALSWIFTNDLIDQCILWREKALIM